MSVLHSNALGYRTSFAREGQHRKVSATREWHDAPLARPTRSGDRRLAVQVLLKASPPASTARRLATSQTRRPSPRRRNTDTVSLPPASACSAPTPVVLQKPARQASQTAETRDPRAPGRFPRPAKSHELRSPGALTPSAGRGCSPVRLAPTAPTHGTWRAPGAPDSPAFHYVPLHYAPVGPVPTRSPHRAAEGNKRGGTAPKRGARGLPTTPLRYTA
jgi:hypothetical protein